MHSETPLGLYKVACNLKCPLAEGQHVLTSTSITAVFLLRFGRLKHPFGKTYNIARDRCLSCHSIRAKGPSSKRYQWACLNIMNPKCPDFICKTSTPQGIWYAFVPSKVPIFKNVQTSRVAIWHLVPRTLVKPW